MANSSIDSAIPHQIRVYGDSSHCLCLFPTADERVPSSFPVRVILCSTGGKRCNWLFEPDDINAYYYLYSEGVAGSEVRLDFVAFDSMSTLIMGPSGDEYNNQHWNFARAWTPFQIGSLGFPAGSTRPGVLANVPVNGTLNAVCLVDPSAVGSSVATWDLVPVSDDGVAVTSGFPPPSTAASTANVQHVQSTTAPESALTVITTSALTVITTSASTGLTSSALTSTQATKTELPSQSPASSDTNHTLPVALGVGLGGGAAIFALAVLIWWLVKRRKQPPRDTELANMAGAILIEADSSEEPASSPSTGDGYGTASLPARQDDPVPEHTVTTSTAAQNGPTSDTNAPPTSNPPRESVILQGVVIFLDSDVRDNRASAVLDTGACMSIITQRMVERLGMAESIEQSDNDARQITGRTVLGHAIRPDRFIDLTIQLSNQTVSTRARFYVMESFIFETVLSYRTCRDLGVIRRTEEGHERLFFPILEDNVEITEEEQAEIEERNRQRERDQAARDAMARERAQDGS